MLVLDDLTKTFASLTAVDRVSLEVPTGQMVGVIGRSGAGKSTLLRLLNRLGDATSGAVRFDDIDVIGLRGRALHHWRARCAMIFQQFNLVPRLDVITNVLIGRLNRHPLHRTMMLRFSDAERAMAVRALDRLDMADAALQRADTLSGGQQQRVAIARAMMQEPDILLADEPIASLDPRSAAKVMDALMAINREDGITVICNLHTLDTARRCCDRIIGMAAGRVVFDGAPGELTGQAARAIYGASEAEEQLDDAVTSTALPDRQADDLPAAAYA